MNLRLPGPIPVPNEILEAMAKPMINHRGPAYKEMLARITDRLKQVFQTTGDVYILTASGTGAMEATITNTLSPSDKVLCASIGGFGHRFAEIARIFGADVVMLNSAPGTSIKLDKLHSVLESDPAISAVLVTHNETSTGVTNDLEKIADIVKKEFNKLLLVDGISSVGSLPLQTDAWGCDVVATASQKGWMLPPGLAFISFSEKAWEANATSTMPKFYFDLSEYRSYFAKGQPPWTPAISQMFALDLALEEMMTQGLDNIYQQHAEIGKFTRDGLRTLGLTILPEESIASNSVTAVCVPDGIDVKNLLMQLDENHGVILAAGQDSLAEKIFRIGHMGRTTKGEIENVLNSLTSVLTNLGFNPAQSR